MVPAREYGSHRPTPELVAEGTRAIWRLEDEMRLRSPRLEEMCYLYEKLSPEERDDLLQSLLAAAPDGGKAMIGVVDELLLCRSLEELLEEHAS